MDAYDHYIEENGGIPPQSAFQLVNFSRSNVTIPTLSYNKALIIFQKHTSIQSASKTKPVKSKKSRSKKRSKAPKPPSRIQTSPSENTVENLSLSTTTPTSIDDDDIEYHYSNTPNVQQSPHQMNLFKAKPLSKSKSSSDVMAYRLGDHVLLTKNREGVIRFIGTTHFTKGIVYGVELVGSITGKHDGAIDGVRYFQTDAYRGLFVKKSQLLRHHPSVPAYPPPPVSTHRSFPATDILNEVIRPAQSLSALDLSPTANASINGQGRRKSKPFKPSKSSNTDQIRTRRRSSSAKRVPDSTPLFTPNRTGSQDDLSIPQNQDNLKNAAAMLISRDIEIDDSKEVTSNSPKSQNSVDSKSRSPRARRSRTHRKSSFDRAQSGSAMASKADSKRTRQSVDDMDIDRESKESDFEDAPSPPPWDRVHSRIPDHRQNGHVEDTVAKPASFAAFQQNAADIDWDHIPQRISRSETVALPRGHVPGGYGGYNHHNGHRATGPVPVFSKNAAQSIQPNQTFKSARERRKERNKRHHQTAYQPPDNMSIGIQRRGSMDAPPPPPSKPKHSRFGSLSNLFSFGGKSKQRKVKSSKKRKDDIPVKPKRKRLIFGVEPTTLKSAKCDGYEAPIPIVLTKLKAELFMNDGHLIEGIFRVAPNATECKQIEEALDRGEIDQMEWDEIGGAVIANLIKIWFRLLPHPVLQSVESAKIEKVQQTHNIDDAERIILEMENPFRTYFEWLLDLCIDICAHEETNKMTAKNMAVVVAPNLYDPTRIANPMTAMTISQAIVVFVQVAVDWRQQNMAL